MHQITGVMLTSLQEPYKKVMLAMFDWLVPVSIRIATKGCKMLVAQDEIHMVQSLCHLYEAQLGLLIGEGADITKVEKLPPTATCRAKIVGRQAITELEKLNLPGCRGARSRAGVVLHFCPRLEHRVICRYRGPGNLRQVGFRPRRVQGSVLGPA